VNTPVLITLSRAAQFQAANPQCSAPVRLDLGAVDGPALLAAIVVHGLAHSLGGQDAGPQVRSLALLTLAGCAIQPSVALPTSRSPQRATF